MFLSPSPTGIIYCTRIIVVLLLLPTLLSNSAVIPFDFQGFIASPKDEIKQCAAELFAIVTVATARSDDIVDAVKELMGKFEDKVRPGTVL